MHVIEAVELVACHVFNLAEQTRQRLTFGDVERSSDLYPDLCKWVVRFDASCWLFPTPAGWLRAEPVARGHAQKLSATPMVAM